MSSKLAVFLTTVKQDYHQKFTEVYQEKAKNNWELDEGDEPNDNQMKKFADAMVKDNPDCLVTASTTPPTETPEETQARLQKEKEAADKAEADRLAKEEAEKNKQKNVSKEQGNRNNTEATIGSGPKAADDNTTGDKSNAPVTGMNTAKPLDTEVILVDDNVFSFEKDLGFDTYDGSLDAFNKLVDSWAKVASSKEIGKKFFVGGQAKFDFAQLPKDPVLLRSALRAAFYCCVNGPISINKPKDDWPGLRGTYNIKSFFPGYTSHVGGLTNNIWKDFCSRVSRILDHTSESMRSCNMWKQYGKLWPDCDLEFTSKAEKKAKAQQQYLSTVKLI